MWFCWDQQPRGDQLTGMWSGTLGTPGYRWRPQTWWGWKCYPSRCRTGLCCCRSLCWEAWWGRLCPECSPPPGPWPGTCAFARWHPELRSLWPSNWGPLRSRCLCRTLPLLEERQRYCWAASGTRVIKADHRVLHYATVSSREAAVEASAVDVVDRFGISAVEELLFVVVVFVLRLQLLLHQLVALPQRRVLDALNLPVRQQRFYWCVLHKSQKLQQVWKHIQRWKLAKGQNTHCSIMEKNPYPEPVVKPNVLSPALEKSLPPSEGQTASSIFEGVEALYWICQELRPPGEPNWGLTTRVWQCPRLRMFLPFLSLLLLFKCPSRTMTPWGPAALRRLQRFVPTLFITWEPATWTSLEQRLTLMMFAGSPVALVFVSTSMYSGEPAGSGNLLTRRPCMSSHSGGTAAAQLKDMSR